MDRTLKAVYIWIVLALVWMGLELLLYGEIQLRTRVYITRRRTMYKIVKSECLADKIYLICQAF